MCLRLGFIHPLYETCRRYTMHVSQYTSIYDIEATNALWNGKHNDFMTTAYLIALRVSVCMPRARKPNNDAKIVKHRTAAFNSTVIFFLLLRRSALDRDVNGSSFSFFSSVAIYFLQFIRAHTIATVYIVY